MRLSRMPFLSFAMGLGAVLGGGVVFKLSTVAGMALAVPVLKGMLAGAVAGLGLWVALRVFLFTEL